MLLTDSLRAYHVKCEEYNYLEGHTLILKFHISCASIPRETHEQPYLLLEVSFINFLPPSIPKQMTLLISPL